jgi:hypothetical protein
MRRCEVLAPAPRAMVGDRERLIDVGLNEIN